MANTGSLLSRHLPNGTSTYYTYGALGRLASETDAISKWAYSTYDAAGIPRREKFTTDGTDGHG